MKKERFNLYVIIIGLVLVALILPAKLILWKEMGIYAWLPIWLSLAIPLFGVINFSEEYPLWVRIMLSLLVSMLLLAVYISFAKLYYRKFSDIIIPKVRILINFV